MVVLSIFLRDGMKAAPPTKITQNLGFQGDHMKNVLVISMGMILLFMLTPNAFSQTCVPAGGNINIGPSTTSFDFISNGLPSNDSCWDKKNVNFVANTPDCGWSSNAFELAVSSSAGMSQ